MFVTCISVQTNANGFETIHWADVFMAIFTSTGVRAILSLLGGYIPYGVQA